MTFMSDLFHYFKNGTKIIILIISLKQFFKH